jgi:hypothetical protein
MQNFVKSIKYIIKQSYNFSQEIPKELDPLQDIKFGLHMWWIQSEHNQIGAHEQVCIHQEPMPGQNPALPGMQTHKSTLKNVVFF